MAKFRITSVPQNKKLNTYAGGGATCPRGYVRDASGKCVPYNFNDVQAADSYKGMYGGYDKKGVKNLKQETIVAKKGKKFSDYVLRQGKTKADMAKKSGKDAGQYFGMPGESLQPTNFTKAGLEKYYKTIKDAKKNFEAEEKNREEYEKAVKKKESGKMSTDKFARQYKEKGWADKYDPATMKEGYKGQWQDAVDEANARKTENYELVKNLAGELSGYNAAGRIYDNPLGTLKGAGQTVADVASLPFGLTTGAYNYATEGNFDMGQNIIGQNYGEGLDEVGDVASVLPFGSMLGTAGKAAKLTKAGDVAGDLGKFITTQTPVKNTYKVLGRDSKFFNPGEQPNWLKGYQQTWDPDVADLAPLAEFDKKLKTTELIPKFKKQYQSITDKKNSITIDYRKKIQKAKDNPELIKKAEQERESAMAKMTEATDKFEADVLNYNIKKYSPFEKQIGSGGFGKVFSIPGSDKVVKIGRQAPGEIPEELIKKAQGINKPNVALPKRIENLDGQIDATVMNKVDNLENSPESIISGTQVKPTSQAYEQLVYDIQDLQDRGLYADFQNPDNIIFNPQTGKYHIYDLNTTGHYMSKNITPEMGYKFKADTQFPGIQVPDTEGHSVLKILKDQGKVPKNFELPNYADLETTKIADDLTFRKVNPYKTKNTDNDYGKTLVAHVTKGEGLAGDQAISLRKYKQPSGEEVYYFNANMKNPIEAGKAFKKLESQIPKGAIIQEPASLSLDSWSALLRQAKNPKKFQVYPGNKVPLNTEAIHKKLPNQDKLLRGLEDETGWESKMAAYATREDAQEAADYINTLIPKEFRATKANVFQNDPKKEIYNIAVPNYRIKKMYKQGGSNKGCPPGQYWNGTKCTKLYTLKNDKKYIDGVADWRMHVSDPNMITSTYNDNIKDRLYSGKWGFDPESGALVRLDKIQPQSVTKLDDKTKASREKEKLTEQTYKAEEENKKAYEQSIKSAGFDPATFGKAKGVNTITGEPIYASSKEEAERINQEAINQFAIEGHAAVVNNPVFQAASYFTPWGMAIGAMRGAARLAPDTYNFAKDPSWSGAGQIAMDIAETTPFAKPITNTVKSAVQNTYKINPWAFKPNPKMMYRQIGESGLKDALENGVIRSQDMQTFPYPHFLKGNKFEGLSSTGSGATGKLPNIIAETNPYLKKGVPDINVMQRHPGSEIYVGTEREMPLSDFNLYKKHWLQGYKEVSKKLPGSPNASISGRLKQFFDRPPGPLMLGMPTGSSGNMVKKNISYYEQLLNTYDSKVMSATNKKFYKDLISTAKKQDGMLTEAQLRELDRLKTGNFDFGKRGFNKESLTQVEPKAPIETPKSEFKSEIDWGKWNSEIPNNKTLMQEYSAIEQQAKANGSWMRNPDGSTFNGTPEQFVQQNSENFKKAFGNSKLINPDGSPTIQYHGSAKKFDTFDESKFQLGDSGYSGKGIYTSPSKTTADSYSVSSAKFHKGDIEPTVYELYGQANNPISSSQLINENKGRDLFNFHRDRNWQGELSPYESLREYDAAISDQLTGVQNIRPWHDAREVVFPTNKQLKSAIGNNGMFDMSNPNIYKAIIPTVGVTGLTGLMLANPFQGSSGLPQQKKGGITNDYIEMDIPKSKVQWYIDNGYDVEVLE